MVLTTPKTHIISKFWLLLPPKEVHGAPLKSKLSAFFIGSFKWRHCLRVECEPYRMTMQTIIFYHLPVEWWRFTGGSKYSRKNVTKKGNYTVVYTIYAKKRKGCANKLYYRCEQRLWRIEKFANRWIDFLALHFNHWSNLLAPKQ